MKHGLSLKERLERSCIPVPESGCWLWLNRCMPNNGYGVIRINGKTALAHRMSWLAHFGNIPDGLSVLHRCDVRSCINPDHLFLGTHKTNAADMFAKGRESRRDGWYNGRAKLTAFQLERIRSTDVSCRRLAREIGVCRQTIHRARTGQRWKQI